MGRYVWIVHMTGHSFLDKRVIYILVKTIFKSGNVITLNTFIISIIESVFTIFDVIQMEQFVLWRTLREEIMRFRRNE